MSKKTSVMLTDAAWEILKNHRINMMRNSIKNISISDAINDVLEKLK